MNINTLLAAQTRSVAQGEEPNGGLLVATRNAIQSAHQYLDKLHELADFHAGVREIPSPDKAPHCVPNGLAEELREEAYGLLDRLGALLERLQAL